MTANQFSTHGLGGVAVAILIIFLAVSFFYTPYDPNEMNISQRLQPPSAQHWFGSDEFGRDLFSRIMAGARVSLLVGFLSASIAALFGTLIGALSGYFGGWLDNLLMRFTEAVLIIPQIFLLLVMAKFFAGDIPDVSLFGRQFSGSVVVIIVIIGITSWPYLARIVRAEFLSIKENEFVLAARATGTSTGEIIFLHILPNCVAPIVVSATLGVANAITLEAYISFLGLGVRPPTATWGNMLEGAYNYIETAYWLWLFPGLLILLIVLGINFVGDGLRDALDPRSRTV